MQWLAGCHTPWASLEGSTLRECNGGASVRLVILFYVDLCFDEPLWVTQYAAAAGANPLHSADVNYSLTV